MAQNKTMQQKNAKNRRLMMKESIAASLSDSIMDDRRRAKIHSRYKSSYALPQVDPVKGFCAKYNVSQECMSLIIQIADEIKGGV